MIQYVYPAVFFEENGGVTIVFPDLNISTEGNTFEEAYLFAKDYLRVYCTYGLKYDLDIEKPSKYESVQTRFKPAIVMLVDTMIGKNDLR